MNKLYAILGLNPEALQQEIKKAYRSLAQTHHPDKGGDVETFHQIQLAYDVLGNKERRQKYDATGDTGQKSGNPYSVVEQRTMNLFTGIIAEGEFSKDIIKSAKNKVEGKIQELAKLSYEGAKELLLLEKQLGRVEFDSDDNLFQNLLEAKVGEIKRELEHLAGEIKILEEMLEYLDHYADQRVPQAPQYTMGDITNPWVNSSL